MSVITEYNRHELVDTVRRWNPKTMRDGPNAADVMDLVNAVAADNLNILVDLEEYAPIVLSPTRCGANDIKNSMVLNGIEPSVSLTVDQSRRLTIIASSLRTWRGAFSSLRSLVTALTGGPVIVTTWLIDAPVVGVSSWDMILLTEDDENTSQVFLLEDQFTEEQLERYVDGLARTALDDTIYVPCFTLTAWRDGPGKWTANSYELVASSITGEFESLDIGPEVSSELVHNVRSTDTHDVGSNIWMTIWFKTENATDGSYWRFVVASDAANLVSAYGVRVSVGNHEVTVIRIDSGADTDLGSIRCNLRDSSLVWHRIDVILVRTATEVAVRTVINGNYSGIFVDSAALRPNGTYCEYWTDNADFPTGRLRTTVITATQR